MIMMSMRLEKLRHIDLNLLITFAAIAEEKSVTAAASRLLLSQPAVSRALQRARALFQDDLLVRSPSGFELTLRGRRILDELEGLVPRMEGLVAPTAFDPVREKSHWVYLVNGRVYLLKKGRIAAAMLKITPVTSRASIAS
jgi:molybdenum-dependent DNA-binding transcriptional regulator ModE